MKKSCKLFAVGALLALVAVSQAAKREDVDLYQWSIRGVMVDATAAQLNTVYSNIANVATNAVLTITRQTVAAGTNIDHTTRINALDEVTPAFGAVWTNATAAVTVIGGGAVVTNATLTLTTNLIYDSTGAACTNAAGESVYVVTWCEPALETGAITATSALTPETGDFVSGITSNVVTPLNTVTLQTAPVAAVTNVAIEIQRVP